MNAGAGFSHSELKLPVASYFIEELNEKKRCCVIEQETAAAIKYEHILLLERKSLKLVMLDSRK
jgi:hypothetical protein